MFQAIEAKALVAGDPDVLKRVQLQTEIVRLEVLRAAHLDRQVQARWELKRLPGRIEELQTRVAAIAADVSFRDAEAARVAGSGGPPFAIIVVDDRTYTDRAQAAPVFAAALERGAEATWTAGQGRGAGPAIVIATYRGFEVSVRPAALGSVRLGLRCPDRQDALEYATPRTLEAAQAAAYGTGLFGRLDHLLAALNAELKAARDGLAREETNLASYTEQLARPFEHTEALLDSQRELARIEGKLRMSQSPWNFGRSKADY